MLEARLFQALSDPTRLRILALLARSPMNVSSMVEELACAQPAVSRHLRVLRDVALLRDRRKGKEVEYSLNHDQLNLAAEYLQGLLTSGDAGTLRSAEAVVAAVVGETVAVAAGVGAGEGAGVGAGEGVGEDAGDGGSISAAGPAPRRSRTRKSKSRKPRPAKPRPAKPRPRPAPGYVVEREPDTMDDFLL